jgi:DNA-binding transcriptional LysR family regulator
MMIEAGLGYAFTFDNLVYTGRDSPLTFRPLNPPLDASLFLVWKKYQTFTNAGSAFLEKIKSDFENIETAKKLIL